MSALRPLRHLGALLLLLAGPAALAGPPTQPAPVMPAQVPARVQVQVRVVRASYGAVALDPRLSGVASALQRTGFQAFSQLDDQVMLLADGQRGNVVLPDGRTVSLTLVRHAPEEAQVHVQVQRQGAEPVVTALTVKRDRAFLYALKTPEPQVALLLLVEVRY